MSDIAYLYRHYNEEGTLLYVGKTITPGKRQSAHRRTSDWWEEVRMITIEPRHGTEPDILLAETDAITTERPLYNKLHKHEPGGSNGVHPRLLKDIETLPLEATYNKIGRDGLRHRLIATYTSFLDVYNCLVAGVLTGALPLDPDNDGALIKDLETLNHQITTTERLLTEYEDERSPWVFEALMIAIGAADATAAVKELYDLIDRKSVV